MRQLSYLCLIILLIILSAPSFAQTGEIENFLQIRSICAEAERELIEITIAPAITEVIINPRDDKAIAWYPAGQTTRRFWIALSNDYISVTDFVGGITAGTFIHSLGEAPDCESQFLSTTPMNECLGLPLSDFLAAIAYEPQEEGFVVDGLFYPFHETLSFFVPVDAVWIWDLYVDSRHVLRFEQDEANPCSITAIYPQ